MEAITVVHEDQALLVLDKPAGLLSVPGRGPDKQDCLARRAQQRWPDAQVVHRLDMATSGLVVMARGAAVQRRLSMAFEARAVDKRYVAVVAGRPEIFDIEKSSFNGVSPVAGSSVIADPRTCPRPEDSAGGSYDGQPGACWLPVSGMRLTM